jgi:hypothetical protein
LVAADPDALQEWHAALETARHFNDLLIRLRGIALPVTLSAAAFAAGADLSTTWSGVRVEWLISAFGVGFVALALMLTVAFWQHRRGDPGRGEDLSADPLTLEWMIYGLVALGPGVAACILVARRDAGDVAAPDLPVEIPLLAFAMVVATLVYLLDRYYYFRLLIGAAGRAEDIEKTLGFRLTSTVTTTTPSAPARLLITLLYVVPVMCGMAVLVVFAAVAGG